MPISQVKLDNKDRRILLELDTDSTQSLSDIAGKIHITKEAVSYRIKSLESAGVIVNYTTIYNSTKLGLLYFKIYIKFAHVTEDDKKQIRDFVSEKRNFSWLAMSEGSFDMMIGVHFPSVFEFEKYKNEFISKFGLLFQKCTYAILTEGETYPRQYIIGIENSARKAFVFCNPDVKKNLDQIDVSIVKEISLNARLRVTEIASKTGLTPSIVRYRKKLLEKSGIIAGYKIFVNYRKLTNMLFKCMLKLKSAEPSRCRDLKLYVRQHSNIIYWMKVLGDWDVELDIEVSSAEELYKITNEIRSNFSDIVQNLDVLLITNDSAINH